MGNLSYDFATIAILLCILIAGGITKNKVMLQNKAFLIIVLADLIAAVADIMGVYGDAHAASFSMTYHQIFSYCYFLALNCVPFAYAFYIITLKKNSLSIFTKAEKCFLFIPICVSFVFVLTNHFTHAVFYYDVNMQYFRGSYQFVLYTVSFYYTFFGLVYSMLFMRKSLSRAHKIAVYLFVVIGIGGSLIQLFIPDFYISAFAVSVCILMLLLSIQKPADGVNTKIGILNYDSFVRVFNLQITGGNECSVFLLYIENVALMNQAIGISKVDEFFSMIGKYLCSKSNNQAFYLGGNVFAMILDTTDEKDLQTFASQIRSRFENPWVSGETDIYMQMRLLELHIPRDAASMEGIQAYKDYLKDPLNRAKVYLQARDTSIAMTKRRMQVEAAINRAIESDGFEVYYQPIYSTKYQKITSAEALLRLRDPDLGFIPPDEFIVVAENNGSILEIGDIVFEKVCKFLSEQRTEEMGIHYVEVNLSVVQCMQERLADKLLTIMHKYNIPYGCVNLEITETAANSSPIMLIKNMKKLYNKGVTFSLDDFGTGYSNMSAIMELPLDMIKFDKSMIMSADRSHKGKIIFLSSVAMIKQMNMKIVAEGIETKEQKEMMEDSGIEYLQGYYFSKPVPETEFVDFVMKFNEPAV